MAHGGTGEGSPGAPTATGRYGMGPPLEKNVPAGRLALSLNPVATVANLSRKCLKSLTVAKSPRERQGPL
jgi:hypothetical protein